MAEFQGCLWGPAHSGMDEQGNAQRGSRFVYGKRSAVARLEILQRGVKLQSLQPHCDGTLELARRALPQGINARESDEAVTPAAQFNHLLVGTYGAFPCTT